MALWYKRQKGSGKPIVLIHGAGSNHTIWSPYLEILKGRDVTVLDLPGHGNSHHEPYQSLAQSASLVAEVIHSENLKRCLVVGQSLGAVIASETRKAAPDRVERLAMIGPFSKGIVKGELFWKAVSRAFKAASLPPTGRKSFQDYSLHFGAPLWRFPSVDLRGTHLRTCAKSVSDLIEHRIDWGLLGCPCLIILGDKDSLISRQEVERIAEKNGNVEIKTVECHHLAVTHAKDQMACILRSIA